MTVTAADQFAGELLRAALEHHERFYINGNHKEADCELCHLVSDTALETGLSIRAIKDELAERARLAEGFRRQMQAWGGDPNFKPGGESQE